MVLKLEDSIKAIFFDRDGVLNLDKGYVYRSDDFFWVEGAVEAIKFARSRGYLIFVVTNQSGVARGFYRIEDVIQLHEWMNEELKKFGTKIDQFFYCPYHDEGVVPKFIKSNHPDRKPNPGMILRAMKEFSVDREKSLLIGDKQSDMEAARRAGVEGLLFPGGNLFEVLQNWYHNKNSVNI